MSIHSSSPTTVTVTATNKSNGSADSAKSRYCVIVPEMRPPLEEDISHLSEKDQSLLESLLQEPVDYVDHDLFAKADAEETLYGGPAVLRENSTYFNETTEPDPVLDNIVTGTSLKAGHEVLLFQRLNYARRRIATIVEGHHGLRISSEALRELLGWAHRAQDARGKIIQANLPLVLAMAKRTRLNGLDFNEMISEGNFALLRAVDKFDCSRGYKFSTYACRAILKSFSRVALRTSRYRVRFPTEFDPELEKSDFSERQRDGVEMECLHEIREILARNRAELNDIERKVLSERFSLDAPQATAKPKTLEQVGELIGVTKERVRQIQNKALAKIRAALEESYLAA